MINFLRSKSTAVSIITGVIAILVILYAWELPPFKSSVEGTDNAYIKGYIIILSPQVAGNIAHVYVKDFERVNEGQLLIEIDDATYRQKLNQSMATLNLQKAALANSQQQEEGAKAQIRAAEAEIANEKAVFHKAELNWKRIEPLTKRGISSESDEDSARATLEQANAAVEQANAAFDVATQNLNTIIVARSGLEASVEGAHATVELAKIELEHTKIYAPRSGRVGEVGAKLGQYVAIGTQLVAVVPDEIWIVANYKETQLNNMKIGQPVIIHVDALDGQKMQGKIVRFSPAAGQEFSVLKPDNATGNFTKVTQRIAVRIEFDGNQKYLELLVPGMSVETYIDTNAAGIMPLKK